MRIYVVCDLEGVAGVIDHHQQCQWDVARGWYAPYLGQARIGAVRPFRPEPPFHLRARFIEERLAEGLAGQPNVRRLDAVTVELEHADHPWLLL